MPSKITINGRKYSDNIVKIKIKLGIGGILSGKKV